MMKINPKVQRGGTFNVLRDQAPKTTRANVREALEDHRLHWLALQETRDYLGVLDDIPGYTLFARRSPRGADQNAFLVRDNVRARWRSLKIYDIGGDGWMTKTGHRHVGLKTTALTIGWNRVFSVHLPPSINWPEGVPEGPPERVDDYVNGMKWYLNHADRHVNADGRLSQVIQRERYGSDHPLVTFKCHRVGRARGLTYVGDWNCRPGRDEGRFTVSWLAENADMKIGKARNAHGHLHGIDIPLMKEQR